MRRRLKIGGVIIWTPFELAELRWIGDGEERRGSERVNEKISWSELER